jgi:hypothetical protein
MDSDKAVGVTFLHLWPTIMSVQCLDLAGAKALWVMTTVHYCCLNQHPDGPVLKPPVTTQPHWVAPVAMLALLVPVVLPH